MKKILIILGCLIILLTPCIGLSKTYCALSTDECIEFLYNGRVFEYDLSKNKKTSSIFYQNYEINKYNRFGSFQQRKELLMYMIKIGFDKNVALNYLFPNLDSKLDEIDKNIKTEPKDASLKIKPNTEKVFYITPEVVGVRLDKIALYNLIYSHYVNNQPMQIQVPTKQTLPNVLAQDFKNYSYLRADFSTNISSSSEDRKHNIKNALNSLNKVMLNPGQTFSFNKTVGRRTEANGYRMAKIILNNEFVDGVGGGVCQVSTTLYNTALLAGLKIDEANKHSRQVGYVKYGFDAMVNYGSSDLRFTNNTNQKIVIITNYSSTKARIRIFGEDLGNIKYKLKNEIVSTTEPVEEIVVDSEEKYTDKVLYEDESFYLQRAYKGMEIKSYREIYQNNKKIGEEFLRHDKYKVQNAIKVVGAKKREQTNELDFETILDLVG